MSELINNREHRQEVLKEIILDLHKGVDPLEIKERFKELLKHVGPTEISEIEQRLIDEGLAAEEIQRLCDVHVSIFKDSLDQQVQEQTGDPAHPVQVFRAENEAISKLVTELKATLDQIMEAKTGEKVEGLWSTWQEGHRRLLEVEKHYSRKENLLFPYLEKHGISGPPSVMWSIHDEIRDGLKEISQIFTTEEPVAQKQLSRLICDQVLPTLNSIEEMVYKENNILFPMCQETLAEDQWQAIAQESSGIGYALIRPEEIVDTLPLEVAEVPQGFMKFDTGILSLKEIEAIFNHLPLDITFVGKDDTVRYFSQGPERIFERTRAIIGRKVQHCHPPSSVHVVLEIVEDFKSGRRDHADFWIEMNGMFVFIRYFAVRDEKGEYLGTLEVTQNVKEIRELQGEKRILD